MKIILVLLSALLMGLSLPNELLHFGSSLLGLIALVPLYIVFVNIKKRRTMAMLFGLWVALVHVISSFWLAYFKDFAIFTIGVSTIAYFVLSSFFGTFFFVTMRKKHIRPIAFAVIWVFWEYFKSTGFLAYPWGTIFMTSYQFKALIQIADITGVWGISFLMALFASLIGEIILFIANNNIKHLPQKGKYIINFAILNICLFTIAFSYGTFKLNQKVNPKTSLNIAVIQENVDSWTTTNYTQQLEKSINLTNDVLSTSNKKVDLILWSEGSLLYSYPLNKEYYKQYPKNYSFTDFLAEKQIPIFAGTTTVAESQENFYHNSACLISPDGKIQNTYSKIQLVPFAEHMPFIQYEFVQNMFESLVGFSAGYLPGTEYKTIELQKSTGETINFIAPICFEDAFPQVCAKLHNKKAELMINLTNDAWSNTKSAEYQHFVVAHFRTIELRTTMVRSTNGGYSCVIDPWGNVIADLPVFEKTGMVTEVPIYEYTNTFYAKYKDWLPALAIILMLGYVAHIKKALRNRNFRELNLER